MRRKNGLRPSAVWDTEAYIGCDINISTKPISFLFRMALGKHCRKIQPNRHIPPDLEPVDG